MKEYYEKNHKDRFDFLNFDDVTINKIWKFKKNLYNEKGLKEILTNAFGSFYDKTDYDNPSNSAQYDFRNFNYLIKILYKGKIQTNYNKGDEQRNLYIIIYEIM